MSTTKQATKKKSGNFAREVAKASGARLLACLQCRKCSCGCPVAGRADIKPHELVRLIQMGERDEILGCRMLWECTSCETCVTRCPQNIDIPAMVDSLRQIARAEGKTVESTTVPVFNDAFLRAVRSMGRTYEAGLMASYKLRTFRIMEDMDKVPTMLRKGKLALLPKFVRGGAERKRMFSKAKAAEGKGR